MAASSPQWERISLSDSYWMAEVSMEMRAQKRLYASGSFGSQKMVMFGSGPGPRCSRVRVLSRRYEVLVTRVRPSSPKPASDQVAQYGSPEKIAS